MIKWLNNNKRIWNLEDKEKPCHKLKFCPYGQLVEEFPIHEEAEEYAIKHNRWVKMVKGKGWVRCDKKEKGAFPDINWASKYVKEPFACKTFGHDCPVYYLAEEMVE